MHTPDPILGSIDISISWTKPWVGLFEGILMSNLKILLNIIKI